MTEERLGTNKNLQQLWIVASSHETDRVGLSAMSDKGNRCQSCGVWLGHRGGSYSTIQVANNFYCTVPRTPDHRMGSHIQ